MTHILLCASAFCIVFLLGIQQQNVHGRHYRTAAITSIGIGLAQIYLWRNIPSATGSEVIATLAGGPIGIVCAMYFHPRIMKRFKK